MRLFPVALTAASLAAATAAVAAGAYSPTDAERARWTMSDMRSLVICMEAYKKDHGAYPSGASLEAVIPLVQSMYIRVAPVADAWGHPFKWIPLTSGFRIVSAGADGTFEEATWGVEASNLDFDRDAVAEAGSLTRVWQYK